MRIEKKATTTIEGYREAKKKGNAKEIIKALSKSYGDSNEEQGKMVNLFKGLAFSDDAEANKFMKALDQWTTTYANNMKDSKKKKKESSLSESGTYPSPMSYATIIIKKGAGKFIIDQYGYNSTDLVPSGEYYFSYSNQRDSFNLESVRNDRNFYILSEKAFEELYRAGLLEGGRLNEDSPEGEYLTIEEDVEIPETDIILEKGDKIILVKSPIKERATVNSDMYNVAYEYLDSMKRKGISPDSISSAVMSNIMTKYEEIHGSLHYDKEAYKDFSASFRKALKDVYGREGFDAFRQANKKIR